MPFPTRVIPTRTDVEDCLHNNAVTNILEKVAVSNMIGLLTQMNLLSKHASEVYGDVLKEANTNLERIDKCKKRLLAIEEQVPATERRLLEKAPSFFYDNPYTGKEWQRNDTLRGLLFRRERASMEVNRRRANAEKPPDISSMDRFAEDKKPCIKKFTDADFFMNEWLEAERLRGEEQKRKRKERKEKRKRKKEQRVVTKKILKVQKKTYNTLGAEFTSKDATKTEEYIEVKGFNNLDGPSDGNTEYESRTSQGGRMTTPDGGEPQGKVSNATGPTSSEANNSGSTTQAHVVVTPPEQQDEGDELDKLDTELDDHDDEHQKNDTVLFNDSKSHQTQPNYAVSVHAPVEVVPVIQQTNRTALSSITSYDAIPTMNNEEDEQREIMTPEKMIYRSRQQAEERMAREDEERKKAAEKQKAANLVPMKGTGLLAQIRDIQTRGNLKKVEVVERAPTADPRNQLLSAIKTTQKLKHVDASQVQPKEEPKKEEGGIFEVLKRRKFMEESEESSGSEWGSESD